MTIRIYPSRLPGEPLETHEHGPVTIHQWMKANVDGYRVDMQHPVVIEVGGEAIPPAAWFDFALKPDDDVRFYPVPYGTGLEIAAWVAVGVSIATTAYTLFFAPGVDSGGYSSASGKSLDLNPAKANTAKLGDPIREVFGRFKIYPDYVVQPVTRFSPEDPTVMTVEMFLCLGVGDFTFSDGDVRIGSTPIASLGEGLEYTVYKPYTNVSADSRSENWFNSTEVGGTSSGTGLDMAQTAPDSDEVTAESVYVSGTSVSFKGLTPDEDGIAVYELPDGWVSGTLLQLTIPDSYVVTNSGAYSKITSDTLEEIDPYVGMPVTLFYNDAPYELFVASYTPHADATQTAQAVTASITLAYGSASGTAFTGLPEGLARLSISHSGYEYRINSVDAATVVVQRVINGVVDPAWSGFVARTVLDFEASSLNTNDRWMGPFLACPENEVTDMLEINFSFPNGICGFSSKGKKRERAVQWEIQYRSYGSGGAWLSKKGEYVVKNVNGLGFTERIQLPASGLYEVRCRRLNEQGEDNSRDNMYWQALRGRLLARPSQYAGVTTIGVTVQTGGKLAAQSDRRVNIIATRNYYNGTPRTLSGALYHVGESLGLAMDSSAIDSLEATWWTPEGDFFDYSTNDSTTALDMLQKIANAGKSYFLLSDGLASVGREGVKSWLGAITPQEMIDDLQTAFKAPSADDYDGVDVSYINGSTWAEETVLCRSNDNPTPVKIEDYKLDGVVDRDKAYQIGMRRLQKYRQQRLTFTTSTELDAMCYNVGDRIVLTDDIPGSSTISTLIEDVVVNGDQAIITVSEPLDWSLSNPRALIRYQDGSASGLIPVSRVGDYQLSLPYSDSMASFCFDDPSVEPPRLVFCDSSRAGYDAIVAEISPQPDGTCEITAKEYREIFYAYDDATYPGN